MSIFGKLVGGTIGFAIGGPIGAIAGAVFGHAFDAETDIQQHLSSNEETQLTFYIATFSMLAKLARADGNVADEEINSIENFMTNDLNLDYENKAIAMNIFNTALDSREPFNSFASQFYSMFHMQPQMLELMIDILLRVSIADGAISESEEKLILTAAGIFNFGDEKYQKLKSKYVSDIDRYYSVLGCNRNDNDAKLKSQYRKLVSDYHPDKIASKGLPEEFIKFANDKFREIQKSYEFIKKERGIR